MGERLSPFLRRLLLEEAMAPVLALIQTPIPSLVASVVVKAAGVVAVAEVVASVAVASVAVASVVARVPLREWPACLDVGAIPPWFEPLRMTTPTP